MERKRCQERRLNSCLYPIIYIIGGLKGYSGEKGMSRMKTKLLPPVLFIPLAFGGLKGYSGEKWM
jgi:hypothetical protein